MNTRIRLAIAIIVTLFVLITTYAVIQYAKGYRPDIETGTLESNGLLVATSDPEGAQVIVNGELRTATDDTMYFTPGTYTVEIRKQGYIPWKKTLEVQPELVAQTNAHLFPAVPNLQSLTNSGALNPSLSPNGTRLLYIVPQATASAQYADETTPRHGLWIAELTNLPLGFGREIYQLVSGSPPNPRYKWAQAQVYWSPDARQILATFSEPQVLPTDQETANQDETNELTQDQIVRAAYLVNTTENTINSSKLTNIASTYEDILADWQDEKDKEMATKMEKLPEELASLLATSSANLRFAPDETKVLYIATTSAQLAETYIPPVPAASTQPESRQLVPDTSYVYDIKEDRNFMVLDTLQTQEITSCLKEQIEICEEEDTTCKIQQSKPCSKLDWFPTSQHLIYFPGTKIAIMEYDGTNQQTVYAGPIENNYVFPHPSTDKLLLITTLNPDAFPLPNLYTVSLK